MPITVAMIEEKEFKTKFSGYDPVEVDEFLDEICDDMIIMQEEIANLQGRLAQVSRAPAYQPAPVRDANTEASESAQKIIARAQSMYDGMIADAKREASEILAGARAQVENSEIKDMTEERDALRAQIDELRASARAYRDQVLALMQKQRQIMDELDV